MMIMEVPTSLLAAFPPSVDLLLDRARRKTDDAMLMDIAMADYGEQADEMMAELRPIRDTGVVRFPPDGMLCQVLELIHQCNPATPDPPPFRPGPTGLRGHQTRLFACAILLRLRAELVLLHERGEIPVELLRLRARAMSEFSAKAASDPGWEECLVSVSTTTDSVLAQGLASANVLGDEMCEAAAAFLTWRMSRQEHGPDSFLFALGLLILATRLRSGRLTEPDLGAVADWVLAIESLGRAGFPPTYGVPRPLPISVAAGFWEPLVAQLRKDAESIRDAKIRTDLHLCALLLEPIP